MYWFRFALTCILVYGFIELVSTTDVSKFDPKMSSTIQPITSSPSSVPYDSTTLGLVVVGFILSFMLSFGVGANDVANVFGTSVGAKVVSLRQACAIATVAEILGAILLGQPILTSFHFTFPTSNVPFNMESYDSEYLPYIIVGFILSFVLAFGVGANDVANSFGTSVGSGVLTLRRACILATIFETLGAILIGYKVSDTVRKGILDVSLYKDSEKELMLGFISALGGSSVWNILATFLKLPISGTHTIVGATVGFTLCAKGLNGVNWITVCKIAASWFVSPVLSGLMSAVIYIGVRHFILKKKEPLEPGLLSLPFFYGFTVLVNVFSIVHDGPKLLHLENIPWWGSVTISAAGGLLTAMFVQCIVVPRQRKIIQEGINSYGTGSSAVKFTIGSTNENSRSPTPPSTLSRMEEGGNTGESRPSSFPLLSVEKNGYMPVSNKPSETSLDSRDDKNGAVARNIPSNNSQSPLVNQTLSDGSKEVQLKSEDPYTISKLFSFLQILTASFGSFAHGGNDVSNAIGPLIALWAIYTEGSVAQKSETPIYILLYGGLGISVGLWIWGRRVIQTIGEDLTKVTPSSGFTIEIGAAFTVLFASKIGVPISTTHCKVGSVVFVGWCKSSKEGVDWKLFRNIVIAWIITVPLTAGLSAFLMFILSLIFL